MNDIEPSSSWKGKLWVLLFLWPIIAIPYFMNFQIEKTRDLIVFILFIIVSLLWLYILVKKVKEIKKMF
jgi:hypothetical protein